MHWLNQDICAEVFIRVLTLAIVLSHSKLSFGNESNAVRMQILKISVLYCYAVKGWRFLPVSKVVPVVYKNGFLLDQNVGIFYM